MTGLIRKLSASAALPAYVRRLSATHVVRLIDEIGLEDSHEIVSALGADQFREVMAQALWSRAQEGLAEELDVHMLLRWIALWQQDGDAMVCRRLLDLGEDLLVAVFRKMLNVTDRMRRIVEATGIDIGTFAVTPKDRDGWPRLVEALTALWREAPDFLLRVLRRCEVGHSALDYEADDLQLRDALTEDLAAERLARRADIGYVDALDATMFLMVARTTPLNELTDQTEYDVTTARYLTAAARTGSRTSDARFEESGESASQQREFVALDAALCEAGVIEPRHVVAALEGPAAAPTGSELLERAIHRLAESHPDIASARMRELGYLANALFAAAQSSGRPLSESAAARVAIATAALGATHLTPRVVRDAGDCITQIEHMLVADPGVIRLFQVGFHLLSRMPLDCCEAVYKAKDLQSRRRGHVVYLEMEEILGASRLTDLVKEGRFGAAKSVIDGLAAVMDSACCVALRILVDPLPAYPLLLNDADTKPAVYVDRRSRPIDRSEDLERIHAFLARLATQESR